MDSYEQCNFPLFNPKRDSIGRMLITRAFLRAFSECEGMYIQHMASHFGHWLSAGHTFKVSANIGYWSNQKWIKLYNAVFIVMNEENKVLAWQLTRGTSIDTVQSLLTGLYQRHQNAQQEIEGIIIDNCCTVKNKINAIFGSRVLIKLDLFRAIKRILEKIPRKEVTSELREVRQVMIRDLTLCFRDEKDIGKTRKKPTPPSDKMEKNLQDFLKKWSSELLDDMTSNQRSIEPSNQQTTDPSNQRSIEPTIFRTSEPLNHQSIEPSIHRSIDPSNHRSIEPTIHRTYDPSNLRSIEPRTTEPPIHRTIEPTIHQTSDPSNH